MWILSRKFVKHISQIISPQKPWRMLFTEEFVQIMIICSVIKTRMAVGHPESKMESSLPSSWLPLGLRFSLILSFFSSFLSFSLFPSSLPSFLSSCFFPATPVAYGSSHSKGWVGPCSHQLTPQPQQRGIRASSATYTTAHSNTGSLIHCMKPGNSRILMDTSWVHYNWATMGTPLNIFSREGLSSFSDMGHRSLDITVSFNKLQWKGLA